MRKFTIFDESNFEINVTLWGEFCDKFQYKPMDVYIFKNIKVAIYQSMK